MSTKPIVLLTDFGETDWYVAEMKGVLLSLAPMAPLVDFAHEVPPGDVVRAAFLLARGHVAFPEGTVFVVVVDPGVGTARHPIAVRAGGRYYVGPDNGVLEAALEVSGAETRIIADPSLAARASATFHGRDLFAPIAARLALGGETAFEAVGPVLERPQRLPAIAGGAQRTGQDVLAARVLHVDRFGNAITGMTKADFESWLAARDPQGAVFTVFGASGSPPTAIHGLSVTYGSAQDEAQEFIALVGSSGLIELAVPGGHAALRLGVAPGDRVEVRYEEPPAR
ncbi:MAG: SAM hydrolase/SAM-dependent halogenase family protein [Candidatus Eiseniibacteriota bacterium]